jgi:tRNA(adenine34) deaminase
LQNEVLSQRDEKFMLMAIEEAEKAALEDEVPVGAVLSMEDEILAKNHNRTIQKNDPTAHAEILVLRNGAKRLGNYRLGGATLYVTKEPCVMCAGAMVHARIKRLVFGCSDSRMGAVGSVFNIASANELNHKVEVKSGIFAEKCSEILSNFFQDKRI